MQSLIKNTFALYISRFGTQLISFVLIPIISGRLSEGDFSFFLLGMSATAFSIIVFDYSVQAIGVKLVAKNIFSIRRELINVTLVKLFFALSFFIAGMSCLVLMNSFELFLVFLLCIIQGIKPTWFYQARLALKRSTIVELTSKSLTLITIIFFNTSNLSCIYSIFIFFEIFSNVILYLPLINIIKSNLLCSNCREDNYKNRIKKHLDVGFNSFVTRVYGGVYISLPLPVAGMFFPKSELLLLICVDRLIRIINSFLSPIFMTLYPYLNKALDKRKSYIYMATVLVGVFISLFSFLFREPLMLLIFDKNYEDGFSSILFIIPAITTVCSVIGVLEMNMSGSYKTLSKYSAYSCYICITFLSLALISNSVLLLIFSIVIPELLLFFCLIYYYSIKKVDGV